MYKQILLLALIGLSLQVKLIRKINFKNNCQDTVWVGGFAVPLPPSTGWEMKPGSEFSMPVSGSSVAARFWARTDCKWVGDKFQCSTGDCGTPMNNFGIECKGITGQAPATLVEFTLSTSGAPDFYDMSNVDGYNIPVYFGPTPGSFRYVDNPDLGKFNCGSPSCNLDTSRCPRELQFKGASGRTYCYSICAAIYNNEQVQNNKDILGPIASDPMKRDLVCCACGEGTGGCTDPSSHFCCHHLTRGVALEDVVMFKTGLNHLPTLIDTTRSSRISAEMHTAGNSMICRALISVWMLTTTSCSVQKRRASGDSISACICSKATKIDIQSIVGLGMLRSGDLLMSGGSSSCGESWVILFVARGVSILTKFLKKLVFVTQLLLPFFLFVALVLALFSELSMLLQFCISVFEELLSNSLFVLLLLLFAIYILILLSLSSISIVSVTSSRKRGVDILDLLNADRGDRMMGELHFLD
jgi:hypothetical protein